MNGLENDYGQEVDFRRLNVETPEGEAAFKEYQLIGHPSYVLLNPRGEVLWKEVGEAPRERLEQALQDALADQAGS